MRIVVIIFLMFLLLLEKSLRIKAIILCDILWIIYSLYIVIKLSKNKDSKIITKEVTSSLPNESAPSLIRFFYKKKIDNKVFISMLFDMIRKGLIKLVRQNNEYIFIDNTNEESILTKSEEKTKKFLFREIGNTLNCTLKDFTNICTNNSAYIYNEYKSLINTFEYESAKEKYFKPKKSFVESYLFYFVISLIISLYNLVFTPFYYMFIIIFVVLSILVIVVNDTYNIEDDKKDEYKSWLNFKNYLNEDLSKLDNSKLEKYFLYAYVLDSMDAFKASLNKKYKEDTNCFNDNLLLQIVNAKVFDYLDETLNKGINSFTNTSVLFKRNKGRRI